MFFYAVVFASYAVVVVLCCCFRIIRTYFPRQSIETFLTLELVERFKVSKLNLENKMME